LDPPILTFSCKWFSYLIAEIWDFVWYVLITIPSMLSEWEDVIAIYVYIVTGGSIYNMSPCLFVYLSVSQSQNLVDTSPYDLSRRLELSKILHYYLYICAHSFQIHYNLEENDWILLSEQHTHIHTYYNEESGNCIYAPAIFETKNTSLFIFTLKLLKAGPSENQPSLILNNGQFF
jgi:hypothetical protein